MKLRVINAERKFLVYVLVVECHWPAEGGAQVGAQSVRAPERTLATFHIDVVNCSVLGVHARPSVYAQRQNQVCSDAE